MKAHIGEWETDITLTDAEVHTYCKPGNGAETCIWLLCQAEGFVCSYFNKPYGLVDRWEKGLTHAKRDGCNKVKAFDPSNQQSDIVEF